MGKTHSGGKRMRGSERKLQIPAKAGITGGCTSTTVLRDLLQLDETAHRIAWLCANAEPMLDAIRIQLQFRGLLEWIVRAHQFHDAAIPRPGLLNHHYAIVGLLLLANPRQPNHQHKNTPPLEPSIVPMNRHPRQRLPAHCQGSVPWHRGRLPPRIPAPSAPQRYLF